MPRAPQTLKAKALQLLAGRDYGRAELETRLRQWQARRSAKAAALPRADGKDTHATLTANAPPPEEAATAITAVLDEMTQKGFLSDTRAAQSLVLRRMGKLGNRRIQQELHHKGLDAPAIAAALETTRGTELQRAHALWQRKFGAPATTPQDKARQLRYLASRGFAMHTIHTILRHATTDDTAFRDDSDL